MTPNAKAARDGRSSDKLTGAGMFADPDSRLRSAYNGTPRETANTRRRRAAQREAGPLPENALLTVGQRRAEQHICRSCWRGGGAISVRRSPMEVWACAVPDLSCRGLR